jgi:glycosyltransferase involved in cell wall biosynthesis
MVVGSLAESLLGFRGHLMREMAGMGHEVIACAPETSPIVAGRLATAGIAYRALPFNRTGRNPLQDLRSLVAFTRFFLATRPDVVLNYTIKPTIYGSLGAALARVETISSMVTGLGSSFSARTPVEQLVRWLVGRLYRLGLSCNRVVFFQNPDDLQLFVTRGLVRAASRPTLINGSGVDLDYYAVRPLPPTPAFLLIARLIREKGIGEYAAAARLLRERGIEATFDLVGIIDQSDRGVPAAELQDWQDEGIIRFLGRLDDVRPAIAAASVYVLPSYYGEGVPRSILEAMAMGRPVITTDAPGCRETVRDGANGILVPMRDVRALVDAMERLAGNPDLRAAMGAASRRLAEEKFDVRTVNRIILEQLELWHEKAA